MRSERECRRGTRLPIFQNRMFESVRELIESERGNARLVQNAEIRLICNGGVGPERMKCDATYHGWQGESAECDKWLDDVAICRTDYGANRVGRLEGWIPANV